MDQTVRNIPIHHESRSFDQQALDSFSLLEKLLHNRRFHFDDFWYDDMFSRMDRRRRHWDDEMRRKKNDFFTLFPHSGPDNLLICSPFLLPTKLNSDFAILPRFPVAPSEAKESSAVTDKNNQMKSFYDREADGLVHYKVHFNVKDFKPEDVKVSAEGNKLLLTAKSEQKTENSLNYREYSRTIQVPDNVDLSQLKCSVTSDQVLMIDAPVKTPDYQNTVDTVKETPKPLVLPLTHARPPSPQPDRQLVTGKNGLSLINVGDVKKLHLELPLDDEYTPDKIKLAVDGKSILVHARHEEKSENSLSYHEFRREYGIPENVDPNSIRATTSDKTLIVEGDIVA